MKEFFNFLFNRNKKVSQKMATFLFIRKNSLPPFHTNPSFLDAVDYLYLPSNNHSETSKTPLNENEIKATKTS